MNDFDVYLPSNTEFLPTNKSNNYVTKLSKEITLNGTWATLTSNETSFVFRREVEDLWREVVLYTGYYKLERALVDAINKAIDEDDMEKVFSVIKTTQSYTSEKLYSPVQRTIVAYVRNWTW